jgi:4-hydroxy-tetrahydrodipicolinate synthase
MTLPQAGVIAALWTPTDSDGQLLPDQLKTNLEFLQRKGVHGLMVLGSTGEFLHLSLTDRKRFLELVCAQTGALPLMVNISHVRPAAVAELGRHAREVGAGSVALLAPWFYPLAQADLAEFFARAGEAAGLPLFLYNFPERTGHRISLETIAAVADRVRLAGVKQSGAEFDYHRDLVALGREKNFVVLTGGECRLAEAMRLGVSGCVSGLANAVPELVLEIYAATRAGDADRAGLATARVKQLVSALAEVQFPLHVAAAIEARGLPAGQPKQVVSAPTRACYQRVVGQVRALYAQWGVT